MHSFKRLSPVRGTYYRVVYTIVSESVCTVRRNIVVISYMWQFGHLRKRIQFIGWIGSFPPVIRKK